MSENGNGTKSLGLARFVPQFLADRLGNGNGTAKAMVQPGYGYGGQGNWLFDMMVPSQLLPKTNIDWAKEVGDGLGSSVLAGPLNFLMRTFPEAPPIIERRKGQNEWVEEDSHPLTQLLEKPNEFYTGEELWMCTILDFAWGNAYWYKVRNAMGVPIELWWIPRQFIWPWWPTDGSKHIDHYVYRPGGAKTVEIPVRDVVHFRFGRDPRNSRLGLSQLGALMREVGVDDQAANFTAAILRNLGIIGLVLSPKEKGAVAPDKLKELKEYLKQAFTGDKRGDPIAVGGPTDVHLLQYNMQGLDISPLRDVSEERVCAALGLPAAVVGFGTGLQQTKVGATMREMRQLAWTGGIMPQQRMIGKRVAISLLPEFEDGKRQKARFRFDDAEVRALWENASEKHDRIRKDFQAKLIDRATALREQGRAWSDADVGVYYSGPLPTDNQNPTNPAPPTSGGE